MLYYLTGMATERSAVLAYNLLHSGVPEMGERAAAETIIAPIKRQEPGHYAFYQLSARLHWSRLARWQRWLVRRMRTISFAPVGANTPQQVAQFGELMETLRITPSVDDFAGGSRWWSGSCSGRAARGCGAVVRRPGVPGCRGRGSVPERRLTQLVRSPYYLGMHTLSELLATPTWHGPSKPWGSTTPRVRC